MGRVARAAAAALVLAACASCSRPDGEAERGAGARPNVVLVTLDTTRADHLPAYGYAQGSTPRLDAIARQGVLFESCTTPSAFTQPSHASIMTGAYPPFHGVRINGEAALAEEHETLAERFAGAGYQTGAFVGAFVLDGRWGLDQGFDHYDDELDLSQAQIDLAGVQRPANEVVDAALAWLDGERSAPFFAWLHLYDPHAPYEPPEPFRSRFAPRGLTGLYDGEIAFADAQIGRVAAWLERSGLGERTILAVVGDHGEALGSHGELTHGYFVYDYAVQVPLILRLPAGLAAHDPGGVVAHPVRTIDLYVTLLELAGLDVPGSSQGHSLIPLLGGGEPEAPDHAYSESMAPYLQYGWSPMFSLRTERYKYIDAPRPELYDLLADPGETRNILRRERRVAHRMRRALQELHATSGADAPQPAEANLDRETLDRLAALGYLGSSAPARERSGLADPALPDPKDKLEVWGEVSLAGDLINRGDYTTARRHLEKVLELDPEIPQAKRLLATCYLKTDQRDRGRELLDEILQADPDDAQALIAMANLLSQEGRGDEVLALAKRALQVDERSTQAYVLMAEVFMERNDHARALPHLRQAVDIQPKLHRNRQNLAACLVALRRFDEAERLLREILGEHPRFPLAQFHLGLLYEERGDLQQARQAYRAEVEHNADYVPARFNLGAVALELGDAAGYLQQMEEIVEIAPDRPKGYLFLARGLLARGTTDDLERAAELTDTGVELADTDELRALGYFLRADIYSRRGHPAEAEAALAQARSFAARVAAGHGS